MAVRKFPFGYAMVKGKITIEETEAELIREIFTKRADGKSNWEIAKELYGGGHEYFSDSVKKSSCKISAIIYDSRYIGADGYPPIVDTALFEKVQTLKGEAYCKTQTHRPLGGIKKPKQEGLPTATILIPSRTVFEKERALKTMLQSKENDDNNANSETIRQLILDIAAEKYNCIS